MIRMAGTRLLEQAKEKMRTKDSVQQRVQNARRYTNQPGDLPRSTRMTEKPAIQVGHAGIAPVNVSLFQGDGYSAL